MMDKTAILCGGRFWQGGSILAAKTSPVGPILGGIDFGVTIDSIYLRTYTIYGVTSPSSEKPLKCDALQPIWRCFLR